MGVRDWLMRLVRSRAAAPVVRQAFAHLPDRTPGVLARTDLAVAVRHPRPSHRTHILIVPRRPIANLLALRPEDDALLADVFRLAAQLVRESSLDRAGYRLVVNGGPYQEVGQLHFHLVSDGPPEPGDPSADAQREA